MSQFFRIHPETPQPRLIRQAAKIVDDGGVIVYPTDSTYAIGCHLGDKTAVDRIRSLRGVDHDHHFTLVCRDLSELANYARVDKSDYRLLKSLTPGPYTFILRATNEVPRRLVHPKRKTIGLRVPANPISQALLEVLGQPLMSSSLLLPGDEDPMTDASEIRDRLQRRVELVIDGGPGGIEPTTVLRLDNDEVEIERRGVGPVDWLDS